ncbi:nitroreductase family protein [Feifania hominis]|uniref:Nitroreductase family protein n=1 Tax=Feifania hominis TaxID=2763660 RepID=A0A926DF56_9FIRM|nr:nitroreductase family protein [Feifania hominis]MBC8537013.1 nitroreductase family protein [Feifania hominis]
MESSLLDRRSIRRYKAGVALTQQQLHNLLEAGMYAPSAHNSRPWHFVVCTDRDKLRQICEVHPYSKMLETASAAILVCADPEKSPLHYQQDCAAATQNILLAAQQQGLGSCWLGVCPREELMRPMAEIFYIPGNIVPFGIIAVGVPDEQKPRPERFEPEKIHREQW